MRYDLQQTGFGIFRFMLRLFFAVCLFVVSSVSTGFASGNSPADAPGTFKVLIVGNSHVFVNNVPARLRRLLNARNARRAEIRSITRGGASLISFTHRPAVAAALRAQDWNVVVLQEATATFLTPQSRRTFHQAINWFSKRIPKRTRIVLYQTWPWRADSRYFAGRSSNAASLWRAMQTEYRQVAKRRRLTIAPVGRCWMQSARRASLYSHDGNHASIAGSNLAATVIAFTINGDPRGNC